MISLNKLRKINRLYWRKQVCTYFMNYSLSLTPMNSLITCKLGICSGSLHDLHILLNTAINKRQSVSGQYNISVKSTCIIVCIIEQTELFKTNVNKTLSFPVDKNSVQKADDCVHCPPLMSHLRSGTVKRRQPFINEYISCSVFIYLIHLDTLYRLF